MSGRRSGQTSASLACSVAPAIDVERGWWRRSRHGGLSWGAIYLVFLGYPVADLATVERPVWQTALGSFGLAVFVGAYLRLMSVRQFTAPTVLPRFLFGYLGVLLGLSVALPLLFDGSFGGLMLYAAIAFVLCVPSRVAWRSIPVLTAINLAILLVDGADRGSVVILTVLTALCPIGMIGMAQMFALIRELTKTREENARLAVSEERLRFARDLHDLLGHSLSLIVLKSELAGRLLERDSSRSAAEIADIESVARQALLEVREAVSGYRRSLYDEVEGSRAALLAAGIEVSPPVLGASLPGPVESLLGWTVREATTNVLRHSQATSMAMRLVEGPREAVLTIADNGIGPGAAGTVPSGNGLRGIAERLSAAGGALAVGRSEVGGFRLTVTVPLDAPSYAVAPRPQHQATQHQETQHQETQHQATQHQETQHQAAQQRQRERRATRHQEAWPQEPGRAGVQADPGTRADAGARTVAGARADAVAREASPR